MIVCSLPCEHQVSLKRWKQTFINHLHEVWILKCSRHTFFVIYLFIHCKARNKTCQVNKLWIMILFRLQSAVPRINWNLLRHSTNLTDGSKTKYRKITYVKPLSREYQVRPLYQSEKKKRKIVVQAHKNNRNSIQ